MAAKKQKVKAEEALTMWESGDLEGYQFPLYSGASGIEVTALRLQRAIGEINEAAFYFESLGMDTQREELDRSLDRIEVVLGLMGDLLGRDLYIPHSAV